jgi:hypothetical protein
MQSFITASATASGSQAPQSLYDSEVCMPALPGALPEHFLPDETQPEYITRGMFPMYCPNWASIYDDIKDIATSKILIQPLQTLWLNQEAPRQHTARTRAEIKVHPLHTYALQAVQIIAESNEAWNLVLEDSNSKSQF